MRTEQKYVALEFEKMTGVPNAWNNPALMQVRNGFIGGWEAAQSKKSENEAVAWYDKDGVITANPIEFSQPLYTTPPQRKPLTDEEIAEIYVNTSGIDFYLLFARVIEAAHGIKE